MSSPHARFDAIRPLRAAKVPAGLMVAPIIPGLTDRRIPKILDPAAKAGCTHEWLCKFLGERPPPQTVSWQRFGKLCRCACAAV
jgi:hypothetical protein